MFGESFSTDGPEEVQSEDLKFEDLKIEVKTYISRTYPMLWLVALLFLA